MRAEEGGGDDMKVEIERETCAINTHPQKRKQSVVTITGSTSVGPIYICITYTAVGSVTIFFNFLPQNSFFSV